jgi:hypothetical protein
MRPAREIDALLGQIRALVLELHQLEGDGLDGTALSQRRAELRRLKSRLADIVSHDRDLVAA